MDKKNFTFSIQEAETLGVECAIVLAAAKKIDTPSLSTQEISNHIENTLSFLSAAQILNNVKRLIDLRLIKSKTSISKKNNHKPNIYKLKLPSNNNTGKRILESSWIPSDHAYEVLNMGGVNKNFINNKIDEFKMYWLEKNQMRDNWNVLFVDFIRREWVKENSSNKGMPFCINNEWTPTSDAFDVLELANVSKNDALKHLKEFILYWKEAGTALKSWNSKFVDFVKRKELIGSYEEINDKKTKRHNEPGEFSKKFNERTQDESWAEDFEL